MQFVFKDSKPWGVSISSSSFSYCEVFGGKTDLLKHRKLVEIISY